MTKLFLLMFIFAVPGQQSSGWFAPSPLSSDVCIAEGKEHKAKRATNDYQCIGPLPEDSTARNG
jgi:hypothetical protein